MVEYLYDVIRAISGADNMVNAYITDDDENLITEDCSFVIHSGGATDKVIANFNGSYNTELGVWEFLLDTELARGLKGRYLYYIQHKGQPLCFKRPIYFL